MVCTWIVWYDQNEYALEERDSEFRPVLGMHNFEWAQRYLVDSGVSCNRVAGLVCWQPPQVGMWKTNSDAGIREDSRQWSVGMVICNQDGRFVVAGVAGFFSDIAVVEAEVQAVLFGLPIAANLGLSLVEVKTDCQVLFNLLKSDLFLFVLCWPIMWRY